MAQSRGLEAPAIPVNFGLNKEKNYGLFFEVYEHIQRITKQETVEELEYLYFQGTYQICKEAIRYGQSGINIIAGANSEFSIFVLRMNCMLKAFRLVEKTWPNFVATVRITFICSKTGLYKNYSPQLLSEIMKYICDSPDVSRFIDGFDFCGYEGKALLPTVSEVSKHLELEKRRNAKFQHILLSVHSGENFSINSMPKVIEAIGAILECPVNILCHAIPIWIDAHRAEDNLGVRNLQLEILECIRAKNISIEICPTSNICLTPLSSYSQIPIKYFRTVGIDYSICTDNKSILGTTLKRELALASGQ